MEQPLVSTTNTPIQAQKPALLARSVALMKPITWFGPMWAFLCGAVASGATGWNIASILTIMLGIFLAGPILCGVSQVINDYFDREVDALNEPNRLIPAGMVSLKQVIITILILMPVGIAIALYLGRGVSVLTGIGLLLAMGYSAPPLRAKRNGWAGNTLVAISYEGLAWMAGHLAFAELTGGSILVALLYSFGAHGIMSINDYKSIVGDRIAGIRTIPVLYGPKKAAWLIVLTMNLAQLGVLTAFVVWGKWWIVGIIAVIMLLQVPIQKQFIQKPTEMYLKFSAIGVSFFVWGMMVAAVGLRLI
ncbi:MAG: chlorophyll synthase ChlG [Caldilineaceae bacterium]|nr:chlorophyll synthase ChlG [Caldilineaceae bacterium]